MKQFETGKNYYTRSICDHSCIFAYTVIKRTAKMVTLEDEHGKMMRRKIYMSGDVESVSIASYSMAPVVHADEILPGEGPLQELADAMRIADRESLDVAHRRAIFEARTKAAYEALMGA